MKWIAWSFVALGGLTVHIIIMLWLTKNGGVITRLNAWVFSMAAIILIVTHLVSGESFALEKSQLPWLIVAAVSVCVVITFSLKAQKIAPNPGYVSALESLSAIFVALASIYLFQSELSVTKFGGVILCLLGAFLIIV